MRKSLTFIHWFYGLLLSLFPKNYRHEYEDELQIVFELSIKDAIKTGWLEIVIVISREMVELPKAILYEHLREWRKVPMLKRFVSYFDFSHGSWKEFLIAMFPFFLIGGVWPMINILVGAGLLPEPGPVTGGILFILLGALALLLLIGLGTGLPRWSMPYLGIPLSLFSVYGFTQLLERWWIVHYQSLYNHSWFLGQVGFQGFLWVGLTVAALLLVVLVGFVPIFHRFRNDWTLMVFMLYGVAPFALIFTFDEYVNEELFEIAAFLILAVGGWRYLHSDDSRRRFLALITSLTVCLFIAAVAKAIIFSSPSWPYPRYSFSWQNEMMSTIIMWGWIVLSMLIPLALRLLPRAKTRSRIPDAAAI